MRFEGSAGGATLTVHASACSDAVGLAAASRTPSRTVLPVAAAAVIVLLAVPVRASAQECTPQPLASPNGPGVMVDRSCRRFEGEFRNGRLHGQGKVTEVDAQHRVTTVREGRWADGAMWGPGRVEQASGAVAEGEFAEGRLNGRGTITYQDRRRFEGEFFNGDPAGLGRLRTPDGEVTEGVFDRSMRAWGFAVRHLPDGSRLIGEFRNGEPAGQALLVRPDGTRIVQTWTMWGQLRASAPPQPEIGRAHV